MAAGVQVLGSGTAPPWPNLPPDQISPPAFRVPDAWGPSAAPLQPGWEDREAPPSALIPSQPSQGMRLLFLSQRQKPRPSRGIVSPALAADWDATSPAASQQAALALTLATSPQALASLGQGYPIRGFQLHHSWRFPLPLFPFCAHCSFMLELNLCLAPSPHTAPCKAGLGPQGPPPSTPSPPGSYPKSHFPGLRQDPLLLASPHGEYSFPGGLASLPAQSGLGSRPWKDFYIF